MTTDIYIHIGLHRTATTFLQEKYFPKLKNANYIDQLEIYQELVNITTTDKYIWDKTSLKKDTLNAINAKLNPNQKNIISAEALSGFPLLKSINRTIILERLKDLFPNAKIILGIREQLAMLKSLYFLYIREGGVLKFNELIKKTNKYFFGYTIYDNLIETIDLDSLKYTLLVNQLYDLFGKENVLIFLLEELSQSRDAISRLNNFFDEEDLIIDVKSKVNKAFPYKSLLAMRKLNEITRGFKSTDGLRQLQKSKVNKIISWLYSSKNLINNTPYDEDIINHYLEDNKELSILLPHFNIYILKFNTKN